MSLFYVYLSFDHAAKQNWSQQTPLTNILTSSFENITSSPQNIMSCTSFNITRDHMRDYLSNSDPNKFPHFGTIGAPAGEIFHHVTDQQSLQISLHHQCSSHHDSACTTPITSTINDLFPTLFFTSLWTACLQQNDHPSHNHQCIVTTQDWIDLYLDTKTKVSNHLFVHNTCCTSSSTTSYSFIDNPPPLLSFEIAPATVPTHVPNNHIQIRKSNGHIRYYLRAIIYYGNFHFTARFIDTQRHLWAYDSQQNNSNPLHEKSSFDTSNLQYLTTLDGRIAHVYVYAI